MKIIQTIDGQQVEKHYPLKFNQMTVEEVQKGASAEMTDAAATYLIVFAATKAGAFVARIPLDLSFEQVCDHVDGMRQTEAGQIELAAALGAFTECNAFTSRIPVEDLRPEEKKSEDISHQPLSSESLDSTNSSLASLD